MDCVFPCRVWFRFLRDELAKRVLEYFYENTDVLIYDTVFKVASLRFKSESYEDFCKLFTKLGANFTTPKPAVRFPPMLEYSANLANMDVVLFQVSIFFILYVVHPMNPVTFFAFMIFTLLRISMLLAPNWARPKRYQCF